MLGAVPEVVEPSGPRKRKILPVTIQREPTVSESEAPSFPSSLMPATRISNVWDAPSQRIDSHGVTSISFSRRSNASIPTIGRQRPGTIPPVKMMGKGHETPAS